MSRYHKNPEAVSRLSPEQYRVTQRDGTERPFDSAYWDNKEPGIYVNVVSGEPLFASIDKFDSPRLARRSLNSARFATRRGRTRCRWSDHRLMALLAVFGGVGLTIATPPGSSPGIAPVRFGMMLRWIDGWLGRRRWYSPQRWRWTDWMTRNNGQTSLPI